MAVDKAYIWRAAQDRLRQKTTNAQFETWLRGTQLVTVENGVAVLGAPTTFAKEQLETRFRPLIESAIGEVLGARCALSIEVLAARGAADTPTGGQSATSRAPSAGRLARPNAAGSPDSAYARPTLFDLDTSPPSMQPMAPAPSRRADPDPALSLPASPPRQRPAETPAMPAGRGQRAAITTPLGRRRLGRRAPLGTAAQPTMPAEPTPAERWAPPDSVAMGSRARGQAPAPAAQYDDDPQRSADGRQPLTIHNQYGDDEYGEYGEDISDGANADGIGDDGDDGGDEPADMQGAAEGMKPMGAHDSDRATRARYEGYEGYEGQPAPPAATRYTTPSNAPASANGGYGGPFGLVAPRLNARYTFSTFIVGSGNRLAHAASQAVAEAPGYAYNPLFLYGGVGLGKTHLLHAIGHTALASNLTVLYVSSETFTNEIINAIRYRTTEEFRAKYRSVDVLLVDDIQFIAGKDSTEEEFFHTFNSLHETNKQIVMCSDRPPTAIVSLEDRLRSRFEWGLIADIQPPDLETRIAILQTKAEMMRRAVPDDLILFLASRVQSNIRELEGSLNRLLAFAQLQGMPLNLDTAKAAMANLASDARQRRVTIADILAAVADYYHLPADDLRGKQRDKHIVMPRQVAMYLMRQETEASLLEIGQALGGRDHSTVLHGCEKISNEINVNTALRKEVLAIRQKLLE